MSGSSPHARGTLDSIDATFPIFRFIPACAGNALGQNAITDPFAVHPRMRGERARLVASVDWISGSSPHARGTHVLASVGCGTERFIPACAGNAENAINKGSVKSVHPRMRGERGGRLPNTPSPNGSSPHARGTPLMPRGAGGRLRFIPACAGNAGRRASARPPESVHPRMRGERSTS